MTSKYQLYLPSEKQLVNELKRELKELDWPFRRHLWKAETRTDTAWREKSRTENQRNAARIKSRTHLLCYRLRNLDLAGARLRRDHYLTGDRTHRPIFIHRRTILEINCLLQARGHIPHHFFTLRTGRLSSERGYYRRDVLPQWIVWTQAEPLPQRRPDRRTDRQDQFLLFGNSRRRKTHCIHERR